MRISGPTPGSDIPLQISFASDALTLFPNGFTIPGQTVATVNISGGNDAFTFFPGGLTIPKASAGVANLAGGIDAFTLLPNGFTLSIPAAVDGVAYVGDIPIPVINLPAVPGFGNATTTPSSGFFNTGPGGGSGWATPASASRAGGTRLRTRWRARVRGWPTSAGRDRVCSMRARGCRFPQHRRIGVARAGLGSRQRR
ncbi:hypothetical protein [Mycobacterium camsae]|uniref:hypothetical protein n=1 Tax=Mycobacterium gordonae TaxID=1778 RepID=UPI003D6634F7